MKLNAIEISGILLLAMGLLCCVVTVSLQLGMPELTSATKDSQLSPTEQTTLITSFENIKNLSHLGSYIGLIGGAFGVLVGNRFRKQAENEPSNSDKESRGKDQ